MSADFLWKLWVAITIVATVVFVGLVFSWKRRDELKKHSRFVDQLPSLLSTFGVLGTFIGIAVGLFYFDTEDIDGSITNLLEGMKTAFFTSLAGMGCSMILQQVISLHRDKEDKGSDITLASEKIVDAVKLMQKSLENQTAIQDQNQMDFYKIATPLIQTIDKNIKLFSDSVQTISAELTSLKDIASSTQELLRNDINSELKGLGDKLHNEVVDIETQMQKTNLMLNEKFQEFSDLLKKSNTEALVEVMKGVTEEFEKQMNSLISKLVQENFQKLNDSVDRLNTWQVENKEMIGSLTMQYKEMTSQFEETSTTLSTVGNDTKMLVSEGGKLKQIVTALNDVMVEDEKFREITQNLSLAVEYTKDANEEFRNSSEQLTKWVLKQKDFVEAVDVLMKKLEEISKINDYSDKFWAETKKGMNDSVLMLRSGSMQLQQQINGLDQAFYSRLSATLGELDNLITSLMKNRR
ncbi:MAG: hypothetical protein J5554_09235 [Paludibacteraceae bacterium]|nr:hypothetical protein [Paludibacteraceae bacterium]